MTDKMIRRFKVAGVMGDDSGLIQTRETYHKLLVTEMKDEGYVPLLDVNPVWKMTYLGDKYEFEYTMQGVHVGREVSWTIQGIMDGRPIPQPTPKNK
jgi:hypothetical protein